MRKFEDIREARAINSKKMDAYRKFAKAKKIDDDSIRMANDNPKHAETKRMMKDRNFAKALKMYQSASEATEVQEKRSKEDDDAVKAFLKRGGKIKKLPPGRAQGAHGRDDPGKGMAGMLDRGDTKKFGTRKKVRSMGTRPPGSRRESVNEEMMFKVDVEGMPEFVMLGKSPGDIKAQLRKIVKQPSMIKDVERLTRGEVKKRYREMAMSGDPESNIRDKGGD